MSYRKRVSGPDSITSLGSHALRTGAELGVPVRLAVETNRLGTSPVDRKQTFFGTSRARLSKALRALDELEATMPSYAGMAVHDFAGWKALPRRH
jgi:hypothetical protein